jgi:hypothetical protein
MNSVQRLLISGVSFPEAGIPEEEIRSIIKYILSGRDYKARVARANSAGFTFLPPYDSRWQPRPMNSLDRFLKGGWRKGGWETYASREKGGGAHANRLRGGLKMSFRHKVILAFFSALLADIALSFIFWLLIMMGISLFDLESKLGIQIDTFKLLIGTSGILFVLLFLGFLVFIKPKKSKVTS